MKIRRVFESKYENIPIDFTRFDNLILSSNLTDITEKDMKVFKEYFNQFVSNSTIYFMYIRMLGYNTDGKTCPSSDAELEDRFVDYTDKKRSIFEIPEDDIEFYKVLSVRNMIGIMLLVTYQMLLPLISVILLMVF